MNQSQGLYLSVQAQTECPVRHGKPGGYERHNGVLYTIVISNDMPGLPGFPPVLCGYQGAA